MTGFARLGDINMQARAGLPSGWSGVTTGTSRSGRPGRGRDMVGRHCPQRAEPCGCRGVALSALHRPANPAQVVTTRPLSAGAIVTTAACPRLRLVHCGSPGHKADMAAVARVGTRIVISHMVYRRCCRRGGIQITATR